MTGRSRRVLRITDAKGERLALRSRPASANLAETAAFMDGTKRILVFSMAGGTGRSYHADLSCENTERRIHYLLEPGWRADQAIQGLGRTSQVPTAPSFHTSASSRTIRIGGVTVRMVHTSNRRRLQCAGEPTAAALSALWYLGKDNVTPETIARIEAALGPTEFEKLRSADMPAWMVKTFASAVPETTKPCRATLQAGPGFQ